MKGLIKVLIVEDSEDDMQLVLRELRKADYELVFKRVETAEEMSLAFDEQSWDIVLCDYKLPHFSALQALMLAKAKALDVPFIIVSGTIGEETAVDALKSGAQNYVMKENLTRLVPAVERELIDAAMRNQLSEALKVKREFLGSVSHELKTPIAIAKEGASLLLEGSLGSINQKQEEVLKLMQKNLDRLIKLVNSLLIFQRLDAGKMSYNFEENDLNAVIKEVEQEISGLAQEKKLELILRLEEGLPKVKFDKEKLAEVLAHLISNAIRFTTEGSIVVKSQKMKDCLQVCIQDTGEGIRQQDLLKLFQQFEQIKKGMDRKTGGTGLGLVISKKIIDEHKGKIWVESEYGKGSAFYFTIPF
jgi:signal transduction histidine kinase